MKKRLLLLYMYVNYKCVDQPYVNLSSLMMLLSRNVINYAKEAYEHDNARTMLVWNTE